MSRFKRIVILTGAGISAESGIATFRDRDGIWAKVNVADVATPHGFARNPQLVLDFYNQRRKDSRHAKPNAAHLALARLETEHAKTGGSVLVVTQNIDLLHEAAGTRTLVKVHGSIDRARCADAGCPESGTTVATASLDFAAFDARPDPGTVPRCHACGAVMRPHVLWFDEHYGSHPDYGWSDVLAACDAMRLVIAVGTSFSVGVTDLVAGEAARRGIPLFVIDPQGAAIAGRGVVGLRERAEDLLPRVCALVGAAA
jgi:NAD-dependent SIR2 family protein deacetylase